MVLFMRIIGELTRRHYFIAIRVLGVGGHGKKDDIVFLVHVVCNDAFNVAPFLMVDVYSPPYSYM